MPPDRNRSARRLLDGCSPSVAFGPSLERTSGVQIMGVGGLKAGSRASLRRLSASDSPAAGPESLSRGGDAGFIGQPHRLDNSVMRLAPTLPGSLTAIVQ